MFFRVPERTLLKEYARFLKEFSCVFQERKVEAGTAQCKASDAKFIKAVLIDILAPMPIS